MKSTALRGCKKSKFDLLKCTNISGFESLPLMREVGGDSRSEGVKRGFTGFSARYCFIVATGAAGGNGSGIKMKFYA